MARTRSRIPSTPVCNDCNNERDVIDVVDGCWLVEEPSSSSPTPRNDEEAEAQEEVSSSSITTPTNNRTTTRTNARTTTLTRTRTTTSRRPIPHLLFSNTVTLRRLIVLYGPLRYSY